MDAQSKLKEYRQAENEKDFRRKRRKEVLLKALQGDFKFKMFQKGRYLKFKDELTGRTPWNRSDGTLYLRAWYLDVNFIKLLFLCIMKHELNRDGYINTEITIESQDFSDSTQYSLEEYIENTDLLYSWSNATVTAEIPKTIAEIVLYGQ